MVSVGCGEMVFVPHGDHLLGRILNAASHLCSPAEEEEKINALWGQPRHSYIRLDPKLEVETIALDDIESMEAFLNSQLRESLRKDEVLQERLAICAWRLIASAFFCHVEPDGIVYGSDGRVEDVNVLLCCRLGLDAPRVMHRWPETYFLLSYGTTERRVDVKQFPHQFKLGSKSSVRDIKIDAVNGKRVAPISGFPSTLVALLSSSCISTPRTAMLGSVKLATRPQKIDSTIWKPEPYTVKLKLIAKLILRLQWLKVLHVTSVFNQVF